MKILQINKFHYLKGGAERYYLELSKFLEEKGHQVVHFSMADEKNIPSPYAAYFSAPVDFNRTDLSLFTKIKYAFNIIYNFSAKKKLEALLEKEQPDVAHLHNIYHQLSLSVIDALKKQNVPIIMHLHDYKLICPNYKMFCDKKICDRCVGGAYYQCALRKCVKNSYLKSLVAALEAYLHNRILKTYEKIDLFIAPSQYMKDVCVSAGIPEKKIKVIYNFLPPQFMNGVKEVSATDSDYILYWGRLVEEKGIDVLIDAMQAVDENVKLKIVGAGPERANYEARIMNHGLGDKVRLLGPKYGEDLKKIINSAKAIVVSSLWAENMPFTLLEAMAMGKVVLGARIGGLPEIIDNSRTGYLYDIKNKADLSTKINMIMRKSDHDLKIMGEKAKEKIFGLRIEKHYEKLEKLYEKAKNQKKNG